MHRHVYQSLLNWKSKTSRKPLILRGARQVGKTTLLKRFAESEYEQYVYLNFEDKPGLKSLFQEDLDPERIIQVISIAFKQTINPQTTLLIFDEIQECPEALNSLKYFCENAPEYAICAAGSLLGVKLAHIKGFPVGKVDFVDIYPMSYSEFLHAIGEQELAQYLEAIEKIEPLPTLLHEKLTKLFKHYIYVGGMPECVANFREQQDFMQVRKIQQDILDAYNVDFSKHAPKSDIMKISEVWSSLPSQLAKENKKFIYSKIKDSARGRDYDNAIQWLVDAGLVYKVFNINTAKLPLSGYINVNAFKVYILDVGLLGAMADISPTILINDHKLFSHFRGSLIENYVAQALKLIYQQLYYWTSDGMAELDFIVAYNNRIIPIEVKSGSTRQKKSMRVFIEKYKPVLQVVASPANLILDDAVLNCPLYLAGNLVKKLIDLIHDEADA